MQKETQTIAQECRINDYLDLFSRESPQIREKLACDLPAYNTLLSLHAKTFEEFALILRARQQGIDYTDPLFSFKSIKLECPKCGETKKIFRAKENSYLCKSCNSKFSLNPNSISSGTNCSSLTWMKVLHCLLEFYSVKRTCKYCNISANTYYNIRTRLFYAMQLMMDEVKLYGEIQCDNTFARVSYKGSDLTEVDYPEDSLFDIVDYIPRQAKKRGGSSSSAERNLNSICIFTAIDNYGHSVVRYVGIGAATATKLQRAVPEQKYLHNIPTKDPFELTKHKTSPYKMSGSKSFFVSDKEAAIAKYADKISFPIETHVYRRNNKQTKLPKTAHNIQRVNALHKRLKEFFRKTNYVSSKYLPGFLIFFEFIENTGATTQAIGKLFEILVTKETGRPSAFFKDLYTTPNYIFEWTQDHTVLKNLSYNQLLAAYLYHNKKTNSMDISMEEILEQTGYQSNASVRRIYKNIASAGAIELVCLNMKQMTEKNDTSVILPKSRKEPIPQHMLYIYDEYVKILQSPIFKQITFRELLAKINAELHTNYSKGNVWWFFHRIERENERDTDIMELKQMRTHLRANDLILSETEMERGRKCLTTLNRVRAEYRKNNQPLPHRDELLQEVASQVGLAPSTVAKYIANYKKHQKNCRRKIYALINYRRSQLLLPRSANRYTRMGLRLCYYSQRQVLYCYK